MGKIIYIFLIRKNNKKLKNNRVCVYEHDHVVVRIGKQIEKQIEKQDFLYIYDNTCVCICVFVVCVCLFTRACVIKLQNESKSMENH